jgi:hypothetical protein
MNKRGGDFEYGSNGGKRARGNAGAKCELRIMVPSKVGTDPDTRTIANYWSGFDPSVWNTIILVFDCITLFEVQFRSASFYPYLPQSKFRFGDKR